MNIMDFCAMPISEELKFIDNLKLTGSMAVIAEQIVREIRSRLSFLQAVGLSYLTLSRSAATLSGGESQRIRLATQIGSSLMGVLYILRGHSRRYHCRPALHHRPVSVRRKEDPPARKAPGRQWEKPEDLRRGGK